MPACQIAAWTHRKPDGRLRRRGRELHRPPASFAEAPGGGIDRALDAQAGLEIDEMSRLAGDGPHELAAFDDLELVEAEPVAGRRDEAVIGLVHRRRQDAAKALQIAASLGGVELDL